ncbi:MAG: hypothetical protein RL531_1397 [Actinomycetota bacterium]
MTAPAGAPATDARRPGRLGWTVVILVLALGVALPLRGLMRAQGPPMEEGFMLAFPEFVLDGLVPNRDFLHLYGPGSLWALAGTFRVFGVSLATERWFGLLQQIGIIASIVLLARFWGRTVALTCGLVCIALVMPPIGLTALAWDGGVALVGLGLVCILEGRRRSRPDAPDDGAAVRWILAGGILLGLGLTFRLDLVVAAGLGGVTAVWGLGRRARGRLVLGAAIGVAPYLIHLAMAGPVTVFRGMVLDPVVYLRGGRRLPVPPPWDRLDSVLQRVGVEALPRWPSMLSTSAQLALWFWLLIATVLLLLAVGAWAVRRDPGRFEARVLLAVGALSLGLLPQAVQRVDSAHLAWVSCVPVAFLPVAIVELLRILRPSMRLGRRAAVAAVTAAFLVLAVLPHFTARVYYDYTAQSFGYRRTAVAIRHEGRLFYYGRAEVQGAAEALLARIDAITEPGDRLFVGTSDLRRTPYSDAYLYYMLPDLAPATYFVEMDPGMANREGSRMPDDLASADVVVLSSIWKDWSEPNDSRKFGSLESSRVLATRFCQVGSFGDGIYDLYTPRPSDGCAPGTTVPEPPGL